MLSSFLSVFVVAAAVLASAMCCHAADAPTRLRVYIGSASAKEGGRIVLCELDLHTGVLSEPTIAGDKLNPSFLAVHPNRKFLYTFATSGDFDPKTTGGVAAFAIDAATGRLTPLNTRPSHGLGPCHVSVDATGSAVLVANYGGGSAASLPIGADGRLGQAASVLKFEGSSVNKRRQERPHTHSINVDPANRYAFAADLGLDRIFIYKLDTATATLTPNDPPFAAVAPGSGPRHLAFHPTGPFAYVCNELSNDVTAFQYDAAQGTLTTMQTIATLPEPVAGNSTAEIQVHPSGKFVYVSNRGHDSIAIFTVDPATGKLAAAGHAQTGGKTPRHFGIDPTGQFLLAANQASNDVFVFRIDQTTGALMPTGQSIKVDTPLCVKFVAMD
ncbi:MAG: lactonase family protein [Phycisphaeraceae bacterium]